MSKADRIIAQCDELLQKIRKIDDVASAENATSLQEMASEALSLAEHKEEVKTRLGNFVEQLSNIQTEITKKIVPFKEKIFTAFGNTRWFKFVDYPKVWFDGYTGLAWPDVKKILCA